MVYTRLFFVTVCFLIACVFAVPASAAGSSLEFGRSGTVIRMDALVKKMTVSHKTQANAAPVFQSTTQEITTPLEASSTLLSFTTVPTDPVSQVVDRFIQMDDDAYLLLTDVERTKKRAVVLNTLRQFPTEFYASLQSISLKGSVQNSRGLANRHTMILQIAEMPETELAAVLVHELGHVVDGGYLVGSQGAESSFRDGKQVVLTDDASVNFYGISWNDNQEKKATTKKQDFVSGYAMTNPYEDFAETFAYYVLQGSSFRKKAETNDVLNAKYNFMKTSVFGGKEYGQDNGNVVRDVLPWDVTRMSYALDEVFAS